MRYYRARHKAYFDELNWKVYMSDAAMGIAANTQRVAGGVNLNGRWIEMIDNTPQEEDPRSCVEIAHSIWSRIRGEKK